MNDSGSCIFCKIVSGDITASKIYEDEHALAFLDIEPKSPGHTLVIPKHHSAVLAELPDGEVGPLFSAVKKVSALLTGKLGAQGLTMGINQGEVSGQEVGHIHVHIMPRWSGDEGGPIQSVVDNRSKRSLKDVYDAIKSN